jgi:hypothetical protein
MNWTIKLADDKYICDFSTCCQPYSHDILIVVVYIVPVPQF